MNHQIPKVRYGLRDVRVMIERYDVFAVLRGSLIGEKNSIDIFGRFNSFSGIL